MSAVYEEALESVLTPPDARVLTDQIKVGVEACWQLITRAYTERAWDVLGYTSWDDYCTREFGTSRLRLPREERQEVVSSLRESGLSLRAIESATGISRPTIIKDLAASDEVVNSLPPAELESVASEAETDELAEELIAAEPILPPLPENYMDVPGGITEPAPGQADRVAEELANARTSPKPITGTDGKSYPSSRPAVPKDSRRPLVDTARDLGLDVEKLAKRVEKFGADDRLVRNKNEVAPRLRNHLESLIKVCQDLNHQLTPGA